MLYAHVCTHMHPHAIGIPSQLLPVCRVLVYMYVFCNSFQELCSSLISVIISAVKSLQVMLVQNSCPSPQAEKALGLALEPILGLSAALGLGNSRNSATTRQHMLGLELLLYNIQRLPTKLTTSPSPRAGDKLLSEWRISGFLFLKSTKQFLKAQIYILWFWPLFCTFSFLELLPSFMIQAAAHFHLNHSLKHTFSAKPLATDDWIWQKQRLNSEQGFCLSKLFGG